MEPIISPWAIYFADVLPAFDHIIFAIAIIAIISIVGVLIVWGIMEAENVVNEKILNTIKKIICKTLVPITVICFILTAFIPSKKTIYTMLVVNQITPNNIEILGDSAKDVVDYITDEIKELTREEKTEEE